MRLAAVVLLGALCAQAQFILTNYPTPGHAFAAQDSALARAHGVQWLDDSRVARLVAETIRAGERRNFY